MQFLFYDPSLNLTCQVWYKYKLHLVTLTHTPVSGLHGLGWFHAIASWTLASPLSRWECHVQPEQKQGYTNPAENHDWYWSEKVEILGRLRPQNTHFWAIRLTKLLLGHCGSFKVIVIEQFVWIETKTRSISIDFVLTVSNSENQIFLYSLLSQSESIISLIDPFPNLRPWSSIWAADLSLRSILHLSVKRKIMLMVSCRVKVNYTNQRWITVFWFDFGQTVYPWWPECQEPWLRELDESWSESLFFDAICRTFRYFPGIIPCKLFMIRTWMGSSTVK